MSDEYKMIDEVRRLCRVYRRQNNSITRKKLIAISRGRNNGSINLVGESGADRDEAITALAMTIGGPW